jgi:hypothetical protein
MYTIVLFIASLIALVGIGRATSAPHTTGLPVASAVRREETELKAIPRAERRIAAEPICSTTLARLDAHCHGDKPSVSG